MDLDLLVPCIMFESALQPALVSISRHLADKDDSPPYDPSYCMAEYDRLKAGEAASTTSVC